MQKKWNRRRKRPSHHGRIQGFFVQALPLESVQVLTDLMKDLRKITADQ